MKYAIVNDTKTEAAPGTKGACPVCGSDMTPKCGPKVMHHWAHKINQACDPWWENETPWHRAWKNHFPKEWQEVVQWDPQTSEKHIADIQTGSGLIIEFQHSKLSEAERISRESFYGHMMWIVDGSRLKRDYERFKNGIELLHKTNKKGVFIVDDPVRLFHPDWLNNAVDVIFDFKGEQILEQSNDLRNHLFCLLKKGPAENFRRVAVFTREFVIQHALRGTFFVKEGPKNTQQAVPNAYMRYGTTGTREPVKTGVYRTVRRRRRF